MQTSTFKHGRSKAELIEGCKVRFLHPCGHQSTKDFSKGRITKRVGPMAVAMLVRTWATTGVIAPCGKCHPKTPNRQQRPSLMLKR